MAWAVDQSELQAVVRQGCARRMCTISHTDITKVRGMWLTALMVYSIHAKCAGMSTENELNPRSNVMPLSLLWGFLSKAAVDATVLSALPAWGDTVIVQYTARRGSQKAVSLYIHSEVFPQSTWPRTPRFKLRMRGLSVVMVTVRPCRNSITQTVWVLLWEADPRENHEVESASINMPGLYQSRSSSCLFHLSYLILKEVYRENV